MPTPRKQQIDLSVTPYYHCISRCVRRAFLCGMDKESGKNFNHRKTWLVDKIHKLTTIFSIHTCAYAVMSNHYHLVLQVDRESALEWTYEEILERWAKLFKFSKAAEWIDRGLSAKELESHSKTIEAWREKLYDISWFMRVLNEGIARQANKEDDCKGRFWEGRFKSQALLDESALLTCMVYVDLNPVRAKMSTSLEDSDFTSIQQRLKAYQENNKQPKKLAKLQIPGSKSNEHRLPISRADYFELVDSSGRIFQKGKKGKKGKIPDSVKPILEQLKINSETWIETLDTLENQFNHFIGRSDSLQSLQIKQGKQKMRGIQRAKKTFKVKAA